MEFILYYVITGTSNEYGNSFRWVFSKHSLYVLVWFVLIWNEYWYCSRNATLEHSLSKISKIMSKSCMPDLENPQIVVGQMMLCDMVYIYEKDY